MRIKGIATLARLMSFTLAVVCAAICCSPRCDAQILQLPDQQRYDTDSLKRAFADQHYYFGLYKDNYFIFGPALNHKPNRHNTNVKFQISVAQKLTKATLPFNSYLYLFYTQKVFWNVLESSMPMTDLNFNPGIGITKPIFIKNRFIGTAGIILEHESNGRDSIQSRSWERISFVGSVMVDPNFVVSAKFWIPIIDGSAEICRYLSGGIPVPVQRPQIFIVGDAGTSCKGNVQFQYHGGSSLAMVA